MANADDGGEALSAKAGRDRIRGLVEAEEAGEVLSDDAIVDILRKSGIDIARRTVAKYREVMNIPSSVQRGAKSACWPGSAPEGVRGGGLPAACPLFIDKAGPSH
jgi:RNA polymerase sigma-54 factor